MTNKFGEVSIRALLAISCVISACACQRVALGAIPGLGDQRFRLNPSDSAALDFFGYDVGLSGSRAIVGAYGRDDAGGNSGCAYLFDTTTGQQLFKLNASDRAAADLFGYSVGISGKRAIVGAYFDDNLSIDDGSAYLFDASTGQQLFKLSRPNAAQDDHFGISVGIEGSTAIVGAPHTSFGAGDSNSGVAYLFDSTTGQLKFTLRAPDAHSGEQFGQEVVIHDNIAAVGAFADSPHGSGSGSAYLFDATTGMSIRKLVPADGQSSDQFGTSIAVNSKFALVGAALDDDNGVDSGSAYVFDVTTGQQLFKLKPSDGSAQARFGTSVAFSGNLAIIGAARANTYGQESGVAYVFNLSTGEEIMKFRGLDTDAFDDFGTSVGIEGDSIIVGAWSANSPSGLIQAGGAYVFAVPEPSSIIVSMIAIACILCQRSWCS